MSSALARVTGVRTIGCSAIEAAAPCGSRTLFLMGRKHDSFPGKHVAAVHDFTGTHHSRDPDGGYSGEWRSDVSRVGSPRSRGLYQWDLRRHPNVGSGP